jgi:hypothetical protein
LAAAKRVSGVCASGIEEARRWFHTAVPPGLVERLEEQSIEAQEESREFIAPQTNLRVLLSDLRLLAGWHEKLRLLQQHVFPSPTYMFRTYGTSSRPLLPALYTRRLFAGAWRWMMQARSQS